MNGEGFSPEREKDGERGLSNCELNDEELEFIFGGTGASVHPCATPGCDNVAVQGFDLCSKCLVNLKSRQG